MKKISIFSTSKNPSIVKAVRQAFEGNDNLQLIQGAAEAENTLTAITKSKPNVILFDFGSHPEPYDLMEKIIAEDPNRAMVVVVSEKDDADQNRITRLGAHGLIQFPFQPDDLLGMIEQASVNVEFEQESSSGAAVSADHPIANKTFTVFSPKGGVGTSAIASNLAISMHKMLKEDVLIIDGKHQFGHIALYFNIRTGNSISDLIAHAHALDEQLIRQVVIRHNSGVHVLPSPLSFVEAQGIKPKELFDVLQRLQALFPTIIIDGGNSLNENLVTYMDSSDRILLVLNSDIASMRDMRQFMEVAASLSYPKEKSLLLLNLVGKKAAVKREEIERILKMNIFGKIPSDDNMILTSLNEGVPLQVKKPLHPVSKAINDITKGLIKEAQTFQPKSQ